MCANMHGRSLLLPMSLLIEHMYVIKSSVIPGTIPAVCRSGPGKSTLVHLMLHFYVLVAYEGREKRISKQRVHCKMHLMLRFYVLGAY